MNVAVERDVPPRFCQVALCSSNLPRSIELFTTVLGFVDAGGGPFWGSQLAAVQELGDDASCLVWRLVGRSEFMQLELFAHSVPAQRPQPPDWNPSDLGWVRWGVKVEDFDECLRRLADFGITTMTEPMTFGDRIRRVCFRDPFVGAVVEIIEEAHRSSTDENGGCKADVAYATASVADLRGSTSFFAESLGLEPVDPLDVHGPAMEVLWGLAGSECSAMAFKSGSGHVELVSYRPVGRRRPADYRLSDQGLMNIALGFHSRTQLDALAAVLSERFPLTFPLDPGDGPAAGYTHAPDGLSVELMAVPPGFEKACGFVLHSDS